MESQLTILGVYENELPKEFFDRVPFKHELLTIAIEGKDSLMSVLPSLSNKYPHFKKEIEDFGNNISLMAPYESTEPLLNSSNFETGVLHLTVL